MASLPIHESLTPGLSRKALVECRDCWSSRSPLADLSCDWQALSRRRTSVFFRNVFLLDLQGQKPSSLERCVFPHPPTRRSLHAPSPLGPSRRSRDPAVADPAVRGVLWTVRRRGRRAGLRSASGHAQEGRGACGSLSRSEGLPFQRRPGIHAHAQTTRSRPLRDGLASCLKNVSCPVTSHLLDLRTLSATFIWGQGRLPGPGCGEEGGRCFNSSSRAVGPWSTVRGVWCDVVPSGPPCHTCSACAEAPVGPGTWSWRLGTGMQPLCPRVYSTYGCYQR